MSRRMGGGTVGLEPTKTEVERFTVKSLSYTILNQNTETQHNQCLKDY